MNIITLIGTWNESDAGFVVVLEHRSGDYAPVGGRCIQDQTQVTKAELSIKLP